MDVAKLRQMHPKLVYKKYEAGVANGALTLRFHLTLEPGIDFFPMVSIPITGSIELESIKPLIFHLGLIESISYWKAACPSVLEIVAGSLDEKQTSWWHDLYLKGLGEFYYRNAIDFTVPNFLSIVSKGPAVNSIKPPTEAEGDLILAGGGKDTAVTLDLLKDLENKTQIMILNHQPNSVQLSTIAGFDTPLIVNRTIDPKLLKLNNTGYLNGHTPFSAYLAFLSLLVARLYSRKQIIVSNESSASVANLHYKHHPINHQYSKSIEFERAFREYVRRYLDPSVSYFSLLRPLNELHISRQFAKLLEFHMSAISCNAHRGISWCGRCPKCVFSSLMLAPFVEIETLESIFGNNLLESTQNQEMLRMLLGLKGHKPWECVGTEKEAKAALLLYSTKNPEGKVTQMLVKELGSSIEEGQTLIHEVENEWNDEHYVPSDNLTLIKNIWMK